MINTTYQPGYWYWDENQMLRGDKYSSWSDHGKGDSVGAVAFEYICYPNQAWLKESILQCIRHRDDTYLQFYRYPGVGADTMSRDHVAAIILAFYINQDHGELQWILANLPFRISRKYVQTADFWLWQKSIKYKLIQRNNLSNFLADVYFLLNILMMSLVLPFNFLMRKILGIKMLAVEDIWNKRIITGWKTKIAKLIYPDFAFFTLCWQVRIMPDRFLKKILVNILKYGVWKDNFVLKYILTQEPITKEELESFKPISAGYWPRRYDSKIDYGIRYLSEEEYRFNDVNLSMLNYCYREMDKVALNLNPEIFKAIKNNQSPINY